MNFTADLKYPAFIIQAVILAASIVFLLQGGDQYKNLWTFMSIIFIFGLFSLQTTSIRWIYLFPIRPVPSDNGSPIDVSHVDTHILRLILALAVFFFLMGIVVSTAPNAPKWIVIAPNVWVLFTTAILFLAAHVICDWRFNRWLLNNKIRPKFSKSQPRQRLSVQQAQKDLDEQAEKISQTYNGSPVVVITSGSGEAGVPHCITGYSHRGSPTEGRLRHLLGILQTAIQIESRKHV